MSRKEMIFSNQYYFNTIRQLEIPDMAIIAMTKTKLMRGTRGKLEKRVWRKRAEAVQLWGRDCVALLRQVGGLTPP